MARIPSSPPWMRPPRGGTDGEDEAEIGPTAAIGPLPEVGLKVELSHQEIHAHSWRPDLPLGWIWVSRLSAASGLGFPARGEEIQRFGLFARRVKHTRPPPLLHQSFAHAVAAGMERPWKRRGGREEWMEEDDLLGEDYREQDLRHKLQRSMGATSGSSDRQVLRGPRQENGADRRERNDQ